MVTLNGFPYTGFHAPVVKRDVYRPNWAADARRDYTLALARLLASLLPDDVAEGSISTLPLGWRTEWDDAAAAAGRRALEEVAAGLARLESETGKRIRVALEPEPGCTIETVAQASAFLAGLAPEWIGLCLDACHLAVQFERAEDAVALARDAGVSIVKAQVSSALRVPEPGAAAGRRVPRRLRRAALPAPGARARRGRGRGDRRPARGARRRAARRRPSGASTSTCRSTPPTHTTQPELEATLAALAAAPRP